jgi:hypothetical protein
MKLGAIDFLTKPIDGKVLLDAVYKAVERDQEDRARRAPIAADLTSARASHREPPPEMVRDALERVIGSSVFCTCPILVTFLRFIVERALAKDVRAMKAYVIGVEALGLRRDFDPSTNAIVRVTAKRLREALRRYYQTEGATDPIRIHINRGSYVPRLICSSENESDGRVMSPGGSRCTEYRYASVLMEEAIVIRERMQAMVTDLQEAISKSKSNLAQSRSALTSAASIVVTRD